MTFYTRLTYGHSLFTKEKQKENKTKLKKEGGLLQPTANPLQKRRKKRRKEEGGGWPSKPMDNNPLQMKGEDYL